MKGTVVMATAALLAGFMGPSSSAAGPEGPASVPAMEGYLTRDEKLVRIAVAEDRREAGREVLRRFVSDGDWMARQRAALALGRLQDEETAAWVVPLLYDETATVREEAAFALGQIGNATALRPLAGCLGDPFREVRLAACEALGKLGDPGAVDPLLGFTGGGDPALAGEAFLSLARLGVQGTGDGRSDAIRAAVAGLAHPESEVRWRAAYALEVLLPGAPAESAPAGSDNANDTTAAGVDSTALRAFDELRAGAVSALLELLSDQEPLPRLFAMRALGRAGGSGAASVEPEKLAPSLGDPDWRVAVEAARALGRVGGTTAVKALGATLADWRPGGGKPSGGPASEAAAWHRHAAALEALAEAGIPEGVGPAKPYLQHPTPGLRWRAAQTLVTLGSLESRPRLAALLEDDDWTVRSKVAAALGESGSDEIADLLIARLAKEDDPRVRAGYAAGLAATKAPRAVPVLLEMLEEDDPVVIALAADGLGDFKDAREDPRIVPALGRVLHERQGEAWDDARWGVVGGLGKIGGDNAVALLEEALSDTHELVAHDAAEAIEKLTGRTMTPASARSEIPDADAYPDDFGLGAPWQTRQASPRAAVLQTSRGEIEIELASGVWEAVETVSNFARLARDGYFDGLAFHRVVPDFVIQTGCPRGDGWGGPGYRIRCEINRRRYDTGAVGMALAGKDTGGSQFFITHSPQPRLDGRYTIFGHVVRGSDVVDRIREGDRIESVVLETRNGR